MTARFVKTEIVSASTLAFIAILLVTQRHRQQALGHIDGILFSNNLSNGKMGSRNYWFRDAPTQGGWGWGGPGFDQPQARK